MTASMDRMRPLSLSTDTGPFTYSPSCAHHSLNHFTCEINNTCNHISAHELNTAFHLIVMSISTNTIPKKRTRKAARNQSYREPSYDSDYESIPEKTAKPSRHSARLQTAYDDFSHTDTDTEPPSEAEKPPPTRKPRLPRIQKRQTRSSTAHMQELPFRETKRIKLVHKPAEVKISLKFRSSAKQPAPTPTLKRVISRAVIPLWQTLEYQILLKIMKYAAYPLYTGASHDTGSTAWLLRTSTLSRSFHEAALGALLYSPPLYPMHRAHSIARLLKISRQEFGDDLSYPKQKKSSKISIDYRRMVRHLWLEARNVLATKLGVSLDDLLRNTPNLQSLIIYYNHDFVSDKVIWAHPNYSRAKNNWRYSQLYPLLAELPHLVNLRNFEWNARFLTKDDGLLNQFHDFHSSPFHFQRLKSVTLRNFIIEDVDKLNETVVGKSLVGAPDIKPSAQQARLIAWRSRLQEALSKYQELKQLSICNTNIFDSASIGILPTGLEKLEIQNCPCINSDGLQSYLSTKGGQLRELILKGNQYLSLEFTTTLKSYTPMLSLLDVDLTYRDPTSYQDTEPLFDSLLPDGPPTWPEGLEQISIGPLRKLSVEDAENFYQSLIDAAGQLKYLRVLELRTLLPEAGWRDRAVLRTLWTAKFNEIFNVKYNPEIRSPRPITSLPVRVIVKDTSDAHNGGSARSNRNPRRQSQRIADLALSDSQGQISDSQNDPPSPTYSELLDTYKGVGGNDSTTVKDVPLVRQGRCHTVTFELSDQRPAQDQFREDDFLDSEADFEVDGDYRD